MTPDEATLLAVIAELEERLHYQNIARLIKEECYTHQKELFCEDFKVAVRSPRKSGKTWAVCYLMIYTALMIPNARILFLGLSRGSAAEVTWDTIIKICGDERFNIDIQPSISALTFTFPNGSKIRIGGCEDKTMADKYRGPYLHLAIIDEAGSMRGFLFNYLVTEVLEPQFTQTDGRLICVSTPSGTVSSGIYYEVISEGKLGWKRLVWKTEDNLSLREQYLAKLKQLQAENPGVDIRTIPKIAREWFGDIAFDNDEKIYLWNDECLIKSWKPQRPHYILGIDLGFEDKTAFVLTAYNETEKIFYVLDTFAKSKISTEEINEKTDYYLNNYKPIVAIFDTAGGGSKIIQQDIVKRYGKYLIHAAIKPQKRWYIECFNTDMALGKVKILDTTNNSVLIQELKGAVWKDKNGTQVEPDNIPLDAADSMLYSYKQAYHYLSKADPVITEEDKMEQAVLRKMKHQTRSLHNL